MLKEARFNEMFTLVLGWNAAAREFNGREITKKNFLANRKLCEEDASKLAIYPKELEDFTNMCTS